MSGSDHILIHDLERAEAADINNLQSMIARAALEMLAAMAGEERASVFSGWTSQRRSLVLGGLGVVPNGGSIDVRRGVLVQESSSLSPEPGELDSDYRIAFLRNTETLTPPTPGSDTWYLLEAQMEEVVTKTASRDVYDPASETFSTDTLDKQIERRVAFQFTAGTSTQLPSPTGEWLPIAGVFVSAGGGTIEVEDLIDLRPLWDPHSHADGLLGHDRLESRSLETDSVPGSEVETISLQVQARLLGRRLSFTGSSFDPSDYLEPGLSLAADTWYYLYLTTWQGAAPGMLGGPSGTGVLVLSDTAPATGSRLSNSALSLPAPFEGDATGVCVGVLKRNIGNDGWLYTRAQGPEVDLATDDFSVSLTASDGDIETTVTPDTPTTSRMARFLATQDGNGSNVSQTHAVYEVGGSTLNSYEEWTSNADKGSAYKYDVPDGSDHVYLVSNGDDNGGSYSLKLAGFRELD